MLACCMGHFVSHVSFSPNKNARGMRGKLGTLFFRGLLVGRKSNYWYAERNIRKIKYLNPYRDSVIEFSWFPFVLFDYFFSLCCSLENVCTQP